MDIQSFIAIAVGIVAIYFFIKFIVSPIIRAVFGVVIFLVIIYLLQRFFGFNLDQWGLNLNWMLNPANHYINQIKNFLIFIWGNFPKNQ